MRSLFITLILAGTVLAETPYFVANEGQWEGDFQFKCEVGSAVYYVTPQGLTVDFREFKRYPKLRDPRDPLDVLERHEERDSVTVSGHVVQIHYSESPPVLRGGKGGSISKAVATGANKLSHYSSYFFGRDSTKWRSRVGHYERVIVPEVWEGIDIEYRADKLGVETVYHVKPGADPTQIQMAYLGLDAPLRVDSQGNLILTTSLGEVKETAPYSFQLQNRTQKVVSSSVHLLGEKRAGFTLNEYDTNKVLVIDPLIYGTYLGGGAEDDCNVVVPAPDGGVYVAGSTNALSGFPTSPGAYDETGLFAGRRLFCSHFGADGEFLASTLFGEVQTAQNPSTSGGVGDMVHDSLRNALWLCGAGNAGWPVTPDAIDTLINGTYDAILLRISEDLTTLQYCTYFGGSVNESASQIEVNHEGNIVITGGTSSADFPVTPNALFASLQSISDCYLMVYNPSSNVIEFSTYFGGNNVDYAPSALALSPDGRVWFCGRTYSTDIPATVSAFQQALADTAEELGDVIIVGITLAPPTVEYCSYLGGGGGEEPYSLSVSDSILYVAGRTNSIDFPVSFNAFDTTGPALVAPNYWDAFIARLDWNTGEYFGTYLGGSGGELIVNNVFCMSQESITLLGSTGSSDFPVTEDAFQSVLRGEWDGFVVQLSCDLSDLRYGSYIGGTHIDNYNAALVENADSLWIVGNTLSIDLPTTPDAIQPGDNGLSSGFVQHFAIDTTADTTSVVGDILIPLEFRLSAFPNPFNPITTLSFTLPKAAHTELLIHNILGQEVERVHLGRLNAGAHQHIVGNNDWASGIYIATLSTQFSTLTTKLLLIR